MKTILLTFAAIVLSAQTVDTYSSPPIPSEYLTMVDNEAHLNGYWWNAATATERQIYLMAWQDATGHKFVAGHVSVFLVSTRLPARTLPFGQLGQPPQVFQPDLSEPVVDAIRRFNPVLREASGKGSADANN